MWLDELEESVGQKALDFMVKYNVQLLTDEVKAQFNHAGDGSRLDDKYKYYFIMGDGNIHYLSVDFLSNPEKLHRLEVNLINRYGSPA